MKTAYEGTCEPATGAAARAVFHSHAAEPCLLHACELYSRNFSLLSLSSKYACIVPSLRTVLQLTEKKKKNLNLRDDHFFEFDY